MEQQITPADAQAALDRTAKAQNQVADELGLPREYWWAMAGGWIGLGVLGDLTPWPVAAAATLAFGAGHAALASRILNGRQRTQGVRVSAAVAGRRTPFIVIGMLAVFVVLTIGAALVMDADGAGHPAIWAGVLVAVTVALGGDDMLRTLLRWTSR